MTGLQIGLLIFSWLLVGFLSFCVFGIHLMKGKSFDDRFFKYGDCMLMLACIVAGYITPIIVFIACFDWESINRKFIKFLWGLANPGKEEKDAGTEDAKNTDTDDK